MNTQPNEAQYSASATFYAADGSTTMTCPMSSANPPSYVKIVSTGSSEGEAAREVETFAKLTPRVHRLRGRDHVGQRHALRQQLRGVRRQRQRRRHLHPERQPARSRTSPMIWGNVYVPNGSCTIEQQQARSRANVWSNGAVSMSTPRRRRAGPSPTPTAASRAVGRRRRHCGSARSPRSVAGTKYPGTNPGRRAHADLPADHELHDGMDERGLHAVRPYTGASACTHAYNYSIAPAGPSPATTCITNHGSRSTPRAPSPYANNDTTSRCRATSR